MMTAISPSPRAQIITRRTYNRPLPGGAFETWQQTVDRVILHQQWLWERAAPGISWEAYKGELLELRALLLARKASVSGRTLWLGGTDVAKRREASQFNCAFTKVEFINDVVDAFWLLLQGCGVGDNPVVGSLSGFSQRIPTIQVIRSERVGKGGDEHNQETWIADSKTWTIRVGDSAEAWAKAIGKLLAGKYPAATLVLDFSQIRPAGERLAGYGWISGGDLLLSIASEAIAAILNRRAGQLLTALDIMDILNWLGTVLSSRRASEITLLDEQHPESQDFILAKRDYLDSNPQRAQSNNSLVFYSHPGLHRIRELLDLIDSGGGVEPGIVNGEAALRRAPWFSGCNPCGEVLLANKSFCNLVEVNLAAFQEDFAALERAVWIMARANYRQTCVNLEDGILSPAWNQNNEFLRLCGVGLTGIARVSLPAYLLRRLRNAAVLGAYSMADELGMPRPKHITTIKPSGTMSKIMDTTEGCHRPLGRYIFNNVVFSRHDRLVPLLRSYGYRVVDHFHDPQSVLITFPVDWSDVRGLDPDGYNRESAVSQLERYKRLMDNYVDHNCSITVSYAPDELDDIAAWLNRNWDSYVGVTFCPRIDPTKTAKDLGVAYLPQEVVDRATFQEYAGRLEPVDLGDVDGEGAISEEECAGGACPVR